MSASAPCRRPLPIFGVTNGTGSRATVAELGDVNGDGIGDYAVGLPNANAGSGMVYVFLGHAGTLAPTPTALNLGAASFTITGHGGEMLGYAIAGDDVNGDHLDDIAIGAPAAGMPSKADGGAVYIAFGSTHPQSLASTQLYPTGYTNDPTGPASPSPFGSRYDSFGVSAHTGMALAALPDVNGDGFRDIAVGSPDTGIHRPGEGNVAVLYGKPHGVHINLSDLWENGYPYYFHIDFPAHRYQHVGKASPARRSRRRLGRPRDRGSAGADPNGRVDSGSVWIISVTCLPSTRAAACTWSTTAVLGSASRTSPRRRATASTAPRPATVSAARWQASATRTATASPTSRSASRRRRLRDAPAPERSSWCRASAASRSTTLRPLRRAGPAPRRPLRRRSVPQATPPTRRSRCQGMPSPFWSPTPASELPRPSPAAAPSMR